MADPKENLREGETAPPQPPEDKRGDDKSAPQRVGEAAEKAKNLGLEPQPPKPKSI